MAIQPKWLVQKEESLSLKPPFLLALEQVLIVLLFNFSTFPLIILRYDYHIAFLTLHPTKYADLLKVKLEKYKTHTYLVNTGWIGGAYGVGQRMSIKHTRQCIDAVLDGSIEKSQWIQDTVFGFEIPTRLGSVPNEILNPRDSWADKSQYDAQRIKLAEMFQANFQKYIGPGVTDYSSFGPKL